MYWQCMRGRSLSGEIFVGMAALGIALCPGVARAQIVPDSSLGAEGSVVVPEVINGIPSDRIDGGAARGGNLFHSFQEFSVLEGRGAYFSNPTGIQLIFSRVTGGNPSTIFGTLGVLGSADLFFVNPNGIVFGQNARLDVGGSFFATTAESLVFDNGFVFGTENPAALPLLTVNLPVGLQFRGGSGAIASQGASLQVPSGNTLALVGDRISVTGGTLAASAGRLELGSVTEAGTVSIAPDSAGFALGYEGIAAFQDVQLSQQATVSASSITGGTVQLVGRQIAVTQGSLVLAHPLDVAPGGTVRAIASERLVVDGTAPDGSVSAINVGTATAGNAGNIDLTTRQLTVSNGGLISAGTFGAGNAGIITINASELVEVDGVSFDGQNPSLVQAATLGSGNGGTVAIQTQRLIQRNGGEIGVPSGTGGGIAGVINILASESVELLGVSPDGNLPSSLTGSTASSGNAADIQVATRQLTVRDGARILVSTSGSGQGGNLSVNASEFVEVVGISSNGAFSSILTAESEGSGNAGNVAIATDRLLVADGGRISSVGEGTGTPGNIALDAGEIRLENGAVRTTSVIAEGGNITARSPDIQLRQGSEITAAGLGDVTLEGNITIETETLVLLEASRIITSAIAPQGGSNITITSIDGAGADLIVLRSPDSIISAAGSLEIEGDIDFDDLDVLPETAVVDPAALIAQNVCARGQESEFIISGRGGLPANPFEPPPATRFQFPLVEPASPEAERSSFPLSPSPALSASAPIPARGWILQEGRAVLTSYNPENTLPGRSPSSAARCLP